MHSQHIKYALDSLAFLASEVPDNNTKFIIAAS